MKEELEKNIEKWVTNFVFSKGFSIKKISKRKKLSKLEAVNSKILSRTNLCEFSPHFSILIKDSEDKEQLILINRSEKALSLKDIGEMLVYSKMANPLYSFLISLKGYSKQISNQLIEENISKRLFSYSKERSMILFTLESDKIVPESVLPLWKRDFINE